MTKITVYGITSCDTIKKARKWFDSNGISHEFHDYKKTGIDRSTLQGWSKQSGWEILLNRRGTTWRKLDDSVKTDIDEARALDLMVEHTSMIKRPVVEHDNGILIGFDEAEYTRTFC